MQVLYRTSISGENNYLVPRQTEVLHREMDASVTRITETHVLP